MKGPAQIHVSFALSFPPFIVLQALAGKMDSLDLSLISSSLAIKAQEGSPVHATDEESEEIMKAPQEMVTNTWSKYFAAVHHTPLHATHPK